MSYGFKRGDSGKSKENAGICWLPIVAVLVLSMVLRYFSVYIDDELWKGMMPMAKIIMETLWAIGTNISAAFIFLLA
ncbi:MAG: hypothetical protein K0R31_350 [Clostridiales bacterium]|jgi:hypothetical protein|nr:hypothetical protein [Clostridiales bacterium]